MGVNAANVLIEGQFLGGGSCFGNRKTGSQDSICAQFRFIGSAIQLQ